MATNSGPTGAKLYDNQYTKGAFAQITPDEIDRYEIYHVIHPGTAHNAIGTAAVGTSGQTKAFVITNLRPDYPRNLLFDLSGSNDIGGTATVNGFDQFGNAQTEAIGFGTSASPGTQASGSKIFAEVISGSVTFAVGSAGSGTPVLGYANVAGTAGTGTALGCLFGLPTKIASVNDVKSITWDNNTTTTALLGGTVGTSTLVKTAQHAFVGTAAPALTSIYTVTVKSTWDNSGGGKSALAHLPGTP